LAKFQRTVDLEDIEDAAGNIVTTDSSNVTLKLTNASGALENYDRR